MAKSTFLVQGRVTSRTRAGVNGLRVDIVDVKVGGSKVLKTATTDPAGRFEASLSSAPQGKAGFDLQARAYAGDKLVGASEIRYDAAGGAILNVMIADAEASLLGSEYDALSQSIGACFKGGLDTLQEGGDRQD